MKQQKFVDYPYYDYQTTNETQQSIDRNLADGWQIKISYPLLDAHHLIVIYEKDATPGIQ